MALLQEKTLMIIFNILYHQPRKTTRGVRTMIETKQELKFFLVVSLPFLAVSCKSTEFKTASLISENQKEIM